MPDGKQQNINFMKTLLKTKTTIALAMAIACAANISNAYEQPIPPPPSAASADSIPTGIYPGSKLAEVLKLAQNGVDLNVIFNFIANTSESFSLDAQKIIALNDAGVPSTVIDKMLEHDRQLAGPATPPPPSAAPVTTVDMTPPTAPVTVNYFYDTLQPYGTWVDVAGYGRCWRPTTVIYDTSWRPYCDRGRWVYSDCGWYWDSDYAWGATFHYGRWFRDARFGWCWWPETTWGPSWVVWRSGGDSCGWAPLPPMCVYRPDHGFLYYGRTITVGFDFGLDENYFVFVGYNRFFDRHLRDHCEDRRTVRQIFNNTTVINNYNIDRSHRDVVVNQGISVDRFRRGSSREEIKPVAVSSIPNAGRQGWRGRDSEARTSTSEVRNNNTGSGVSQHSSHSEPTRSTPQTIESASGGGRAPRHSALTVTQPEITKPVTPAQTGAVLDQNPKGNAGRTPWRGASKVVDTTPPQSSQLNTYQPRIERPTTAQTVLPPAPVQMQQRAVQQETVNRYYESRRNTGGESGGSRVPANVQTQPVERSTPAPNAQSTQSTQSSNSDNSDRPGRRHH